MNDQILRPRRFAYLLTIQTLYNIHLRKSLLKVVKMTKGIWIVHQPTKVLKPFVLPKRGRRRTKF